MKVLTPTSIVQTGTPEHGTTIALEGNEVAILFYATREVDIITVPELDEIQDMDEYLEELGFNLSEIVYMT